MPSPRQVLIDIHDMGLDPSKPHGHIKASGRLAHHTPAVEEATVVAVVAPIVAAVTPPNVEVEKAPQLPVVEAEAVTEEPAPVHEDHVADLHNEEEHTEAEVQEDVAPTSDTHDVAVGTDVDNS